LKLETSILGLGNQTKGDSMEGHDHETEAHTAPETDEQWAAKIANQPNMVEQMLGITPEPKPVPTLSDAITSVGAKLIAVAPRESDDATIVLAEVPGAYQPYVTWHYGEERGDLFWGHYFSEIENARRDFDKRVKDDSQDSPEAPAEAISEPISEAVSEPISEASSGPEIWVKKTCNRCGVEVRPSSLTGSRLFYEIAALSETHLCADCVLDLMRTDPTCESVMRYVERTEV